MHDRRRRAMRAVSVGAAIVVGAWAVRAVLRSPTTTTRVRETRRAVHSAVKHGPAQTVAEPADPQRSAGSVAAGEERTLDAARSFSRVWVLPLLALTIVSTLGAAWLFLDAYPGAGEPDIGQPTGGLLLLIDAKAPGMDTLGVNSQAPAPAVTVDTWTTGSDGVNILLVKLAFPVAAAGSHWFIVASGQYYPDRELDQSLFCLTGFFVIQETDRIRCRDTPAEGSVGVEYRYNDELGFIDGDTIYGPIDSLAGFDAQRAAIITGTVSDPDTLTRIFIPYRTPRVEHPGGDERARLAPIGVTDQEWGALHPIGNVASGYTGVFGQFADLESGRKLRYMPLSGLRFGVREDTIGDREIAAVVPPTVQSDELVWESAGAGMGPFSYRLHDPYSQDRTAVKAFGAGLIASVGAAALLLLIEQILIRYHRSSTTKPHPRRKGRRAHAEEASNAPGDPAARIYSRME